MSKGSGVSRLVSALALAAAVGLSSIGCGSFKESIEDVERTQTALKSELGADTGVSFRTTNGRTTVVVRLETLPPGDLAIVKTKVTDVVHRTFRTKVAQVDIVF